jgi:hypothetical protein
MWKAALFALTALAVGAVLGLGSAWGAVSRLSLSGRVVDGGWTTNLNIGSTAADPYTRAMVARDGLLALARSETVYFTRFADDAGAPLDAACTYRIKGRDLPARWWSVTLYDQEQYLARNEDGAHSIDATRVVRAGDGYEAVVSGARGDAVNWLSTQGAGKFSLSLRLYNPDPAVQAEPGKAALPTVEKISCAGGA